MWYNASVRNNQGKETQLLKKNHIFVLLSIFIHFKITFQQKKFFNYFGENIVAIFKTCFAFPCGNEESL